MPRLVVAGATSRIGRILSRVWQVEPPGFDVVWTARHPGGPVPASGTACRLTQPGRFAELLDSADLVLDLAAPPRAPGVDQNVTVTLFDALAALAPCPVVTMSSSAVYGAGPDRTEAEAPTPQTAYGRAKAEMEVRVRATPSAVALRLGNVAGADALLGRAEPGRVIRLDRFDDGRTPRRSYLGPLTLARLMAQLCRGALEARLPPILNLCGREAVEMAALLDTAGLDWEPVPAPETALAELTLSADLLSAHVDVPDGAGLAETVIAEWREVRP